MPVLSVACEEGEILSPQNPARQKHDPKKVDMPLGPVLDDATRPEIVEVDEHLANLQDRFDAVREKIGRHPDLKEKIGGEVAEVVDEMEKTERLIDASQERIGHGKPEIGRRLHVALARLERRITRLEKQTGV